MSYRFELLTNETAGLAWKFHVSPSSCDGPENYENFLRLIANTDYNSGMGTTHIMIDNDADRIAGYITFRATALIGEGDRGTKVMSPALEIAMLAVDKDYERQQIGSFLISQALVMAEQLRKELLGIKHIVVCADPKSTAFYSKNHFAPLSAIYDVLHDGFNDNCIPYFITLQEQTPRA